MSTLKVLREKMGLSQAALATLAGTSQPQIKRLEDGDRKLTKEWAERLAPHLETSPEVLIFGMGIEPDPNEDAPPSARPKPNASFPPVYQEFPKVRRIPLLGQSEAGANGMFVLNGAKIDDVFCPPGLENVPDAYAVRVYGTSMEPRYRAGETVWLNPRLPVRVGDDVVLQLKPHHEGGDMASFIKEFRSRNSKVVKLLQHNPEEGEPKELEFKAEDVFSIHKIVHHSTV